MGHSVIIWRITSTFTDTAPGSGGPYTFTAGSYVHAILDDATNTLTSKYSSTSADNTGFEITGGPSLFSDPTGAVVLETVAPFYQYCEGTTLHQVGTSNGWPYATLSNNANNSECTIGNVCDLEISSEYTITPVSAPGATDGAIAGTATSSNGLIKFSMDPNFPYGSSAPGGTMDPLADWEIYNTSSEPFVWTVGATPVAVLTPPSIQTPVLSDIYRMPYSTAWVAGQQYTFPYEYKVESVNSDFCNIYMRGYDEFMNVVVTWNAYGYGNPTGAPVSTFKGQWQFTAPAGMVYIGLEISFPNTITPPGANTVTVVQFGEVLTVDPPGVKTQLNFTGLSAGTYTVYAKDAAGCQDSLSFVLSVTETYRVRYRMGVFQDVMDVSQKFHRIDILERSYTGDPEIVNGGIKPAVVQYKGSADDPNRPLIPSNMRVSLMSESEEQFSDIPLGDDRKYLVEHYTGETADFPSPQLYWTGFIVPEFGSEPYLKAPYEFSLTASDQIGEMKNLPFVDEAENEFRGEMSIIKIIAAVFKTTDLDLPIRCGVNVWADIMNQDDDPLPQGFLDVRIFEGKNCNYVLEEIAKSFRGQIFQSMGYWWFIRLSDAIGSFEYRQFDKDGNYSNSGTFSSFHELGYPDDIFTIDGVFTDRRQLLTRMRNYGKFSIKHDLVKDGNLIDEGRFEEEDLEELSSGNVGFKRWSVTLGQSGVTFGLEKVDNGESKGAFYFDFSGTASDQADTVVYSDIIQFDKYASGRVRFKFQYKVSPKYTIEYSRIAWALKYINDTDGLPYWYGRGAAGNWTIYSTEVKNDIYVSSFDSFNTFDVLLDIPSGVLVRSFQIFFYFHDHAGRDFVDTDALAAFPLPVAPVGMQVMVNNGSEPESWIYVAEYAYDDENIPEIIHPPGFNVGDSNHRVLWRRDKIMGPVIAGAGLLNRINLDNVVLASYPVEPTNATIIDPPATLTYSQTVDSSVKSNLDVPVLIGDMLRIDPETDHYKNERHLYRSFIRLSDGTPTKYWHRLGVAEEKPLLKITLDDYISQFSAPQRKLSGVILSSRIIHFINSVRDNADANRTRYRPMTFEFDVKRAQYTISMSAVNAGANGEPPLILGAFAREEYSAAYDGGHGGDLPPSGFDSAFDPAAFE